MYFYFPDKPHKKIKTEINTRIVNSKQGQSTASYCRLPNPTGE